MRNHYTYLITNLHPQAKERYYIGLRSCKCYPKDDVEYMGSSDCLDDAIRNKGIRNFEKIIIEQWESRKLAAAHEIWLHGWYNVKSNLLFYNKVNATDNGFNTAGTKCGPLPKRHKQKLSNHFKGIARDPLTPAQCNNLSKAMKGKCPTCGTGMFRILGKA